jgi:hypothetical protein
MVGVCNVNLSKPAATLQSKSVMTSKKAARCGFRDNHRGTDLQPTATLNAFFVDGTALVHIVVRPARYDSQQVARNVAPMAGNFLGRTYEIWMATCLRLGRKWVSGTLGLK